MLDFPDGDMTDKRTVVAIVDDENSIRNSLVRLIQSTGGQAEAFASAREFLAHLEPEAISCVVSDLRMPEMSGLQLQDELKCQAPFLPIVFITGHGDIPTTVTALHGGAVDFLEKPVKKNALLEAISRGVERNENLRKAAAEIDKIRARYQELTPREQQVFALVSAGLLNKQVGAQLNAAEKTIKQHRGSVMRKMGAGSLADLVLMAERLGVRPANANFDVAKGKKPSAAADERR